ncbi:MAG TPA: putative nucleotidyltransferase substrate binding domain-containing protein [Solirubrobacteraceae bacterium]|nr:putative nucleotidyltransferase substrate binding domain-containing protein [Solirubrobacteraceae bacterium]
MRRDGEARHRHAARVGAGGAAPGRLIEASEAPAEIARFLRAHPPFDTLDHANVDRVAESVELEFEPAGSTIFSQGGEPVEHLRVVRSGAVELVHHGRVLDLLAEGELFGQTSMLSGLPAGFEARAVQDSVCYRIGADAASELLAGPAAIRFVARSMLETPAGAAAEAREPVRGPADMPVGTLLRGPAVVCGPGTSIRQAAKLMSGAPTSCAIVQLADGELGIVTDRDLRTRVVADGLSGDAPVTAAMSAPAYTCGPERLGGEVLLEMLDRGLRHFPVVSATGEILGVVEDLDVVAGQTRSSFFLRERIARAHSLEELVAAARELRPTVITMHDANVATASIMAVNAVVVDALTRRLLELAVAELGEPAAEFAWLALGSQARREAVPSSDVDSAIVWFGDQPEMGVRPQLHAIATRVVEGLEACGLSQDAHGASAANVLFVRSLESWKHASESWIAYPTQNKALLLSSVLVDSRPVWGVHTGTPVADTFRLAPDRPALLRLLARYALSYRPPTGFLRGLVVEHSGEHRGRLDLKHGGVIPIVDLARWAGMAAGVTTASTTERLRAAGAAGTLSAADTHTLADAFDLIGRLRLEHQVAQLRAGAPPDDYVDPGALSSLTRTHLKEAFRAVAAIQKGVAAELSGVTR